METMELRTKLDEADAVAVRDHNLTTLMFDVSLPHSAIDALRPLLLLAVDTDAPAAGAVVALGAHKDLLDDHETETDGGAYPETQAG